MIMHRTRVFVVLFTTLFLLQTFSAFATQSFDQPDMLESTFESTSSTEPAEPWLMFPEPIEAETTLHTSTGLVALASAKFDPLYDIPQSTSMFTRNNDGEVTGLFLLQLHQRNGEILYSLMEEYGFSSLEFISNEVWLIRAPQDNSEFVDHMLLDERVRWIGSMQPEWRVHPLLLDDVESEQSMLNFIPAPDVSMNGLEQLTLDLLSSGATAVMCGTTLCSISFEHQVLLQLVKRLAFDGRVIWTEPSFSLEVHNANAVTIAGVQGVINKATFTLDGTGETIAIADTGIDRDHPDINGRVAAVYTLFGLDSSSADTNTGHGTHIALTVLGDGTSDSSVRGVAPGAQLVMYALEHDPTGVFGRRGSVYDMLKDAETATARVAVNAWGLNGNYGQYTADARSVDIFMGDYPDMIPFFSIGDRGGQGSSQVTSPGTAKNVISIGASTTGALGSTPPGDVASFSSEGPTLDGRIKPDLVAPGVNICSGRPEESSIASGTACGTGLHSNGQPLYMTLSGTSQATAVASGVGALVREYLREQQSIFTPSGSLIKAVLINGATDLGTPDIPNAYEGWGQINLEQSVMPTSGSTNLGQFYDDKRLIRPGFSLSYPFILDMDKGVELTLAWSDEAGSANAEQSQSRLVNDLDMILEGPNGEIYLGNVFSNGVSTTGGTSDQVNNVERIKIKPGVITGQGNWVVRIEHKGGIAQKFSLVMSAIASPISVADLVTFDGSIILSSVNPLRNDLVSISLAFANQGTANTGSHMIKFEDITTGTTLLQANRSSLVPGGLDSVTIYHSFSTTGLHTLRLTVDLMGQVEEINDESNGTNNNIIEVDVEVMALGVRVLIANDDGTIPQTQSERENNSKITVDVTNGPLVSIPLIVLHEGTGNQSVDISTSMVQMPNAERPDLLDPSIDAWQRAFSGSDNVLMSAQGTENDTYFVDLELLDLDADFSDPESPRYIRAGTYVVDITVRYEFQPTVAHTQRVVLQVPTYHEVLIASAGTNDLRAQPGNSVMFSVSVKNIGNSPAQYSVLCESENRWQIMLGNSNSSRLEFEPLDLHEYLPMTIRIIVPPVANGLPAAGSVDSVTCYVTSLTDSSMNHTEVVEVAVDSYDAYKVRLSDDDGFLGPSSSEEDVAVDSGQFIYMNLSVENAGNREIDLNVRVVPAYESWVVQLSYDGRIDSRQLTLKIPAGQVQIVQLIFGVPEAADEGDENTFIIRTEKSTSNYRTNTTVLVVKDELALDLFGPQNDVVMTKISDSFTFGEYTISNVGNTPLNLEWSNNIPPNGWTIGFSNPVSYLEPRDTATVRIGIMPPAGATISENSFNLQIFVTGTSLNRSVITSINTTIGVVQSMYGNLSLENQASKPFQLVPAEQAETTKLILRNDGNVELNGELTIVVLDKDGEIRNDWSADLSLTNIENLALGEEIELEITATPKNGVSPAKAFLTINLTTENGEVMTLVLDMTSEGAAGDSGFFKDLPVYISVPIAAIVVGSLVILARRMKKSGELASDDSALGLPDMYGNPEHLDARREQALDIDHAINKTASAEVSKDEIAQAILQSMDGPIIPASVPKKLPPGMAALPSANPPKFEVPKGLPPAGMPPSGLPSGLPPQQKSLPQLPAQPTPAPVATGPPLPPEGLPVGWTMEQWNHYGHQWLERQK
jgi:hypothetical protein